MGTNRFLMKEFPNLLLTCPSSFPLSVASDTENTPAFSFPSSSHDVTVPQLSSHFGQYSFPCFFFLCSEHPLLFFSCSLASSSCYRFNCSLNIPSNPMCLQRNSAVSPNKSLSQTVGSATAKTVSERLPITGEVKMAGRGHTYIHHSPRSPRLRHQELSVTSATFCLQYHPSLHEFNQPAPSLPSFPFGYS